MAKTEGWYKLDHAAKLIPSTRTGADTRVFRISCDLTQEIEPATLQKALDAIYPSFPHFNCVLRKGLFWYYLESSPLRPVVYKDDMMPLAPIYIAGRRNLLYRVSYFGRRINLEMFHALADGTGGFFFLKQLVARYLIERHNLDESSVKMEEITEEEESASDAFRNFFRKGTRGEKKGENLLKNLAPRRAYQLRGTKNPDLEVRLVEGTVSLAKMKNIAKDKETTIGILCASLFIKAILDRMPKEKMHRPVVVSVPVNLRQFFPSETTRNFFAVIPITYPSEHYDRTLESILDVVRAEFSEQLDEEKLRAQMRSLASLETNWASRLVPLVLKDSGLQGITFLRNQGVTTNVSNVSRVTMPEALCPYIEKFACFMSTRNAQMTFCSYGDHLTFGITTAFARSDIERNFFRALVDLGMEVEVETSGDNARAEELPSRSARAQRLRRTDAAL